jgi:hypothetical protein
VDGTDGADGAVRTDGAVKTVEFVTEVWRVDDEWWRQPVKRRYFDVVLDGGKHTVLYQDEITGNWCEQNP